MNKLAIFLSCCAMFLAACSESGGVSSGNSATTFTTASTPPLLRAIPTAELSATVTVSGKTVVYSGKDYPDNNWVIYLDVELEKNHSINIEWAVGDVAVMVQQGAFTAENYTDTINPNLTAQSDGVAFDYDCDGVSNLQEIIDGTDPGVDGSCIMESDPITVIGPADILAPTGEPENAVPNFEALLSFFSDSGLSGRVTQYSQPIRVELSNPNRPSHFRTFLVERETNTRIAVDLVDNPVSGKWVRFSTNSDTITLIPDPIKEADYRCNNVVCTMPFEWKDQHWYEVEFEEDPSDSTLIALYLSDKESAIKMPLGSVKLPAPIEWTFPIVATFYQERLDASECAAGLASITLHYRGGIANGVELPGDIRAIPKNLCMRWGSGASTTEIVGDPIGKIFTLTLGNR